MCIHIHLQVVAVVLSKCEEWNTRWSLAEEWKKRNRDGMRERGSLLYSREHAVLQSLGFGICYASLTHPTYCTTIISTHAGHNLLYYIIFSIPRSTSFFLFSWNKIPILQSDFRVRFWPGLRVWTSLLSISHLPLILVRGWLLGLILIIGHRYHFILEWNWDNLEDLLRCVNCDVMKCQWA